MTALAVRPFAAAALTAGVTLALVGAAPGIHRTTAAMLGLGLAWAATTLTSPRARSRTVRGHDTATSPLEAVSTGPAARALGWPARCRTTPSLGRRSVIPAAGKRTTSPWTPVLAAPGMWSCGPAAVEWAAAGPPHPQAVA